MKKGQEIRVLELVHTKEGVVPVEALTAEQKRTLDCWIVKTWVNTLYRGRAEVYYPEAEKVAITDRRYEDAGGPAGDGRTDCHGKRV